MPPSPLLAAVRAKLRAAHYSPRTEQAYVGWIKRFVAYHRTTHPGRMGEIEVAAFLTDLAVRRRVAASTQNQALAALLFLYQSVLGRPLRDLGTLPRAREGHRLPVVLTPEEVSRILGRLEGVPRTVALLLYGGGLRLSEAMELRVKDLDFGRGEMTIRRGKGKKDRVTMLPMSAVPELRRHLARVMVGWRGDVKE